MIERRLFLQSVTASAVLSSSTLLGQEQARSKRIAIIVGPSKHPPGTHEVAASGRLVQHCLKNVSNLPGIEADIHYEWPQDDSAFDSVSSLVFFGDYFPPMRMPDSEGILSKLSILMQRGCGIVCIHYATGLTASDVADDGSHPLLGWMGGYFATKCKHHQSVAKVFPEATITPAATGHEVMRGWREFTLNDEPYIENYFGPDNNQPAANVITFATSLLPPEAPKLQTVAWGVERNDGGRGFAIVMPHFYRNWKDEDLRRFVLNGILWSAKIEVPEGGAKTSLVDLKMFEPDALEPLKARPRKAPDE
jgi:type 1 glutamine amidotransferase